MTAYRDRFFEDYQVGEIAEFGDYPITEQEIIEFASRYDPQPFHVDPQAAARTDFGGLIASGWMTGSIAMRLMVDHFISPNASVASPGLDEVRWLRPVRPGQRLRVRATVVEKRRSRSKPDRGAIQVLQEVMDQHGEVVMTIRGWGLYRCRSSA